MKKNLVLVFVAVVVVSFFLPWVSVESGGAVGKIAKIIKGKEQKVQLYSISGFKVPILANSEESRLMITIIKIFQPNITNADKKSYLIWMLPLLAVMMFLVRNLFKDNKWIHLAIGILGVLIFLGPTYKIATTNLDKLVLKVSIGYGLWLIFIGYLGIGILSLMEFLRLQRK